MANISFSATNVSGRTLSYTTEYSKHMQSLVFSSFVRVDGSVARIVKFLEHVCLKNKHHIAVVQVLVTLSSDEESGLHFVDVFAQHISVKAVQVSNLGRALVTATDADVVERLRSLDF